MSGRDHRTPVRGGGSGGNRGRLAPTQHYRQATSRLGDPGRRLAGCGGWSKRRTLFGADRGPGREPELLDPAADAAKVRAIFVHPAFARRGLGTLLLAHVEAAARAAGFRRFEMGSTPTGVPLYRLKGYVEVERIAVPLSNGEKLPVVGMVKDGFAEPGL